MSFCDISFNRKSGVVTDVLNKEGRESALYPQLVSYVQQDPQTVYDSKKKYFDTLVDQGKLVEPVQGAYDFGASSNSGKWNSANYELLSFVENNRKAFAIYKFLIGDVETFKEIVDFLNEKGIEIPYSNRMKRADETMSTEEIKSAIDSYNNSVVSKKEDKAQVEKNILLENNLQDETEYTPQELIEKYPLTGVEGVIWNLIKDVVNKLGIKVKFSSSRITEGFNGSFNSSNGEILIRPSSLKNKSFGEVLVHEVVHALTTKIISRVNSGVTSGLTQKQINAVKGLMRLFEAVEADNNLESKYPVKDVFEFIAHLTNEAFVKELKSKDRNFLQKVVDFILDILGINNANELAKKYLLDIISDGVFLQENGITSLPSDYRIGIQGIIKKTEQQQTAPLSPDELALGLYSIAYNSGVSEQEFMDRINRDGNLSVFGVGGQVSGQQVFNQVKTASAEIDLNLSNKIQKMLQEKYPEIKLNITNAPVWEQEGNIFNQEEYISQVNYRLKAIEILSSDKAKQIFDKGKKAGWLLDKILTELQIPKEQKKIILDLNITDRDAIVVELATSYSYDVQIDIKPTTAYSQLSVPGGTKYSEIEIATPAIIPSIKGHAQFATDNGIGWFRSDEKLPENYYGKRGLDWKYENDNKTIKHTTRRILEVQSDLFQKGRDKENLATKTIIDEIQEIDDLPFGVAYEEKSTKEIIDNNPNQFLQLLNKDNNWVNFFVKSIIQDSAKKGYEKVLFPSGNTASKVEGHSTLEEFKKQKEDRIKYLEDRINVKYQFWKNGELDFTATTKLAAEHYKESTGLDYKEVKLNDSEQEINQLKEELERVEKEGFGALRPIYNFYENTVANILKKQGYNPVQITDDYGNTWNEVTINQNRDLQNVLLQRDDSRRIIGQANIKAMTVLIDAVNQKQDTLPHEYAHHYIAWFRNTPMVRQAISQWGSEEALVQAIGEQVVAQKREALNWWKRFVRLILSMFGKVSNKDRENIKNMLTNAFLEGRDLQTGQMGISRERSKELAAKATIESDAIKFLNSLKEKALSESTNKIIKSNGLLSKRLMDINQNLLNTKIEKSDTDSIAYNKETNSINVSKLMIDNIDLITLERLILGELLNSASIKALQQNLVKSEYTSRINRTMVELAKRTKPESKEAKIINDGIVSFIVSYLTDQDFYNWVNAREVNKVSMQNNITKVISQALNKSSLEPFIREQMTEYSNKKSAVNFDIKEKPAPKNIDAKKDYYNLVNNIKTTKVTPTFAAIDVQENIESIKTTAKDLNEFYGIDLFSVEEKETGNVLKFDLALFDKTVNENSKMYFEQIKKSNNIEIKKEKSKELMVDLFKDQLGFLTGQEKKEAEALLQRGIFAIKCGI